MIYERVDIVILPFPFITTDGVQQKARPAVIISDNSIKRRFDDVILAGITSQGTDDINQTEFLINEGTDEFIRSGLARTSVVRAERSSAVPTVANPQFTTWNSYNCCQYWEKYFYEYSI